jgi:hypothetical protein
MAKYKALKGKYTDANGMRKGTLFYYSGQKIKRGEILESDTEPMCGQDTSLVNCDSPAFELVEGSPEPARSLTVAPVNSDLQEVANLDPRSRKQIRDDIKKNYGDGVDHRMSKINLIALEMKLKMLHQKDAVLDNSMTTSQAQEALAGR